MRLELAALNWHRNPNRGASLSRRRLLRAVLLPAVLLLGLSSPGPSATPPQFKVIVNARNPASSMSKAEVSKLFLKKTTKWKDGQRAMPVDLPTDSPVRSDFSKFVHGKAASSVTAYWQQQIFSGHDIPPPELGSEMEVVRYVRTNPGAIGYVSDSAAVAEVKVLELTD